MSSELINYLRNTNDIGLINRFIQELNKNQPEVKGDAIQARIPKVSELYNITDTVTSGDAIFYIMTEASENLNTEASDRLIGARSPSN